MANETTVQKSAANNDVLPGVFVRGVAVGNSQHIVGTSKAGKPYQLVKTQVLAGERFCMCTQSVPQGQSPRLFKAGETVVAEIQPRMGDNGVLVLDILAN